MTDLVLLPDCVLPACRNPVEAVGQPCRDCRDVFGEHLQPATGPAITAEQIADRDRQTLAALAAQTAPTYTPPTEPARQPGPGELGERKPNQMCWMCEQRRACTRVRVGGEDRWECASCREVA